MAPEKVFLEVARIYWSLHLAIGAAHSDAEGASLGAPAPSGVQGQRPSGGPGAKPPEIF